MARMPREPEAFGEQVARILNRQFPPFEELREYWAKQFADHLRDEVQRTIEDVYGESMVARIAHSEELRHDPRWGSKRVEERLRSPESLTMAARFRCFESCKTKKNEKTFTTFVRFKALGLSAARGSIYFSDNKRFALSDVVQRRIQLT